MKLVELIDTHKPKRINLIFYHGIGDCIMFIPTVKQLIQLFPNISFSILTLKGQEKLFKLFNVPAEAYTNEKDGIFDDVLIKTIAFKMASPLLTKNEYCCQEEIGIPNVDEPTQKKPTNNNKIIGFHFQNTCLPNYANPPEEYCQQLWGIAKDAGYIPLEIHFIHQYANPVNTKYKFVDFSTRDMACDIDNLMSTISLCKKFVGVSSGPYFCAVHLLGYNNVCFLEKDCRFSEAFRSDFPRLLSYQDDPMKLLGFLNDIEK